ncbi:upstream activation factor subunit spp27-like [Actinia tenebrosa]|uniref:Upstream activation factor subunit spp27-like n=1 Tax=Actinia tenebrosa TaxID=6105 RepID=A0A6P8IQ06_ACTTE|nr:upstream activation factor subunit spp27-like [Actinia tenebrosa]
MVDSAELSVDSLKTAIGDILKSSELSSLTSRIVRNNLEERFNISLKDRKKEIDELLMSMIEENQDQKNEDGDVPTNGAVDSEQESQSEDEDEEPATKKAKKEKKSSVSKSGATNKQMSKKTESRENKDDDDAEVARKLHESERGLRTRKQPAKRTQKNSTKKEPKPKGEKSRTGFGKPMILSPELAEIMEADQLSRSEVVKKMWQIIRERNLTDPKDKRYHICDPQLLKVFGTKRVRTFSMMKYLKQHIKDPALIS